MPGGVFLEAGVRRAFSRAALVEEDDSICRRVKKPAVLFDKAATRPAVQKYNGLSFRISALLIINIVNRRDLKKALIEGLNRTI